jgi:arabinofuranan 3-O-arabinosyltransferase
MARALALVEPPLDSLPEPVGLAAPPSGRWRDIVAYATPVVAAVAATFTWFQSGKFVASGDVSIFVRNGLASEWSWFWSHRLTAAGSDSSEIVRVPDVLIIALTRAFGGSDATAEHVLYALVFAFAAFGGAFLARSFTEQPGAVIAAGLVTAFNPYSLVNLPNALPFVAVGTIGMLAGLLVRVAHGRQVHPTTVALATLPVSYLAVNPPLLVMVPIAVVAIVVAVLAVTPAATGRVVRLVGRAAGWAIAINLWWLVPFAMSTVRRDGVTVSAQTDVLSWIWTQGHSSIGNVIALNGQWTWTHPEYLPYASVLDQPPWVWMRWVLPVVAVLAVAVTRGRTRRVAAALVALGAVFVFVGKGVHPPAGAQNLWLYDHVAGFWLLREPMTKIGPALVAVYAVLTAMTVAAIATRVPTRRPTRRAAGIAVVVLVVAVPTLAYAYPLWTGSAVPGVRPQVPLPPGRVALPGAWTAAARYLNSSPTPGKALVLPIGTFYQASTTWGFHGTDDLVPQLLHRPVIQQLPGGYYAQPPAFDALTDEVQRRLLISDTARVPRLLQALGASFVLLRHDLIDGPVVRGMANDRALGRSLARVRGLKLVRSLGVVDVYELEARPQAAVAYSNWLAVGRADPTGLAAEVASMPSNTATTDASDPAPGGVSWELDGSALERDLDVQTSGPVSIALGGKGDIVYLPRVTDSASGRQLELSDPRSATVDGKPLPESPDLEIPIDRDAVAVRVGTEVRWLDQPMAPVVVSSGSSVASYHLHAEASVLGSFSPVSDCNAADPRPIARAGLVAAQIAGGLQLRARTHDACVFASLNGPRASAFVVSLDARTQAGQPARLCLWEFGPNRCAGLAPISSSAQWQRYRAIAYVDPGTTGLRLHLYADAPDDGETATEYRNVEVLPLTESAPRPLPRASAIRQVRLLEAGTHHVTLTRTEPPSILGAFTNTGDCGAIDDRTVSETGLESTDRAGVLQLRARAHSACVSAPVSSYNTRDIYRLTMQVRTLSGLPARACAWQEGVNACAAAPPLPDQRAWTDYQAVIRPARGTTGLRVFVYADGGAPSATVTEYRNVALRPDTQVTFDVTGRHARPGPAPTISTHEVHPGRYEVHVRDARQPFLLALPESYASGWRISGLPKGARANHVRVDGYANGWAIHTRGTYTVTLDYTPARWPRLALFASLLAGILLLLNLARSTVLSRVKSGRDRR